MTLKEINKLAVQLATIHTNKIQDIKELIIKDTIYGEIVGHFAGSKYFFYYNGKELFRTNYKSEAINFLRYSYEIK